MKDNDKLNIKVPNSLPTGWELTTVENISAVIMGQSPPSSTYNDERKGLPFFQGKTEFGDLYPVAVKWCNDPNKIARKDDVLISVRAPVGPTNLAPSECCIGRGLAAIRPANDIPSKYILYYLRSIESEINSLGTGTTFKAISGGTLRELPITLAPQNERERIVAEIEKQFSRLDEAVANLKRVKANLKRYKAAVLKAAVEGKLTEEWRKAHPGIEPASELLKRILTERKKKWEEAALAKMKTKGKKPTDDKWKDKYVEPATSVADDLPALPSKWTWVTVQQIAQVQLGKMLDAQKHRSGKKLPYLRNINVRWGSVDANDLSEMYFKDQELDRYGLKTGDVLVCEGGEPGRAAKWDGRVNGLMYQKALHRVRFVSGYEASLLVFYLEYLAKGGRLEKTFTGSTIKHLTGESFAILPLPLPPLEEQAQIIAEVESRMSVATQFEAQVNANIMRAERLRQAVLKRAFLGSL